MYDKYKCYVYHHFCLILTVNRCCPVAALNACMLHEESPINT